jgi:hypothetical protein
VQRRDGRADHKISTRPSELTDFALHLPCVLDLQSPELRAYFVCMPSITVTLSSEAYARLKKLKEPGDSFSDVIVRSCESFLILA